MINFIKTIVKSNRFLIILAEKISTNLKINFEREYKIASFIKKPTIIDIGAHLGESIHGFRKYSNDCSIFSFEPNLKLYNRIKKTFKNINKIKIFDYAISNTKIHHLYIPKIFGFELSLWSTFSKSYLKQRWVGFTGINFKKLSLSKIKIKSVKLDQFKFKPHIIKIDAEGCELEIIKSAKKTIKKNMPVLIIEFHHKNFKLIKKELLKMNYYDYLFISSKNNFLKINNDLYNKILSCTTSTNIVFYANKSKLISKKLFNKE